MTGRRRALVLAAVLAAMATAAPTRASGSPTLTIGARALAGLRVDAATPYRRVRDHFDRLAAPAAASFGQGGCTLRFRRIGLVVGFIAGDPTRVGTPAGCLFVSAVATDHRWRTRNGLAPGAPLRALHRLFPHAYDAGRITGSGAGIPAGAEAWQLTSTVGHAAQPLLVAYARAGRVAALGIQIVGH